MMTDTTGNSRQTRHAGRRLAPVSTRLAAALLLPVALVFANPVHAAEAKDAWQCSFTP